MLRTFGKYLLGGIVSYALKSALTWLLVDVFRLWYLTAYAVALTVVALVNFLINLRFVFRVKGRTTARLLQYLVSLAIFSGLDALTVKLLTDGAALHYQASIILSTAIVSLLKFFVYRSVVFRPGPGGSEPIARDL